MRMKILKVVVVLWLSGSGDARPQKTEGSSLLDSSKSNPDERQPLSVPETIGEDSRYTWNSGSSRIPYTNYYRDNIDPLVKRNVEVSVEKSTDVQRSNSNNSWNSSGARLKKPEKLIIEPPSNTNRQIANNFQGRPIKANSSATRRNKFQRKFIRGTILGDPRGNFTISPAEQLGQKLDSGYKRVPLLNPRISLLKRVASKINSTKYGPSRNSSNASKPFRIFNRILLNNSLSNGGALKQNSEFPDQKEGYSFPFNSMSTMVESTTPLDHVKAIKKITSALTQKQSVPVLTGDSKNNVHHVISSILPSQNYLNRYATWINSNATKHRRPVAHQSNSTKKNQNKFSSNKTVPNKNTPTNLNTNLKNWPDGAIQNSDDFHNYDKYTSTIDDSKPEEPVQRPSPLRNTSVIYRVPISRPNLQEIIHWFKIPPFTANASHALDSDHANGPINIAFDPVYQNLEPNEPFGPSGRPNPKPGIVYPVHPSGYDTETSPPWLGNTLPRNKTQTPSVHIPHTQVSQNTVVHLINPASKKPNRTIIGSKVPITSVIPTSNGPSGSSSTSSSNFSPSGTGSHLSSLILPQLYPTQTSTPRPGPNVHIGFTSYEQNNQPPDEQLAQTPLVTYGQSCPTILINSYTRINNTIQSKEGCTDLNIIINSHLFNTNVHKTASPPVAGISDLENYQTYGELDKYGSDVVTAATYQSAPLYQSVSSGSPGWPQNVPYDPQKDPQSQLIQQGDPSSVEVIQDTHISIANSDTPEQSLPIESTLTEDEELAWSDDTGSLLNVSPDANSVVRPAVPPPPTDASSSAVSQSPAALAPVASSTSRPTSVDDDDDYDLSPSGIIESISSVFTYFTFVNPLHYGFFSVAAAPFTALAAGILGIVTFMYPWLFPSSFSFGRSSNNGGDNFWPYLEEMVRQSMDKYGRVNEWKSKRKKRKR